MELNRHLLGLNRYDTTYTYGMAGEIRETLDTQEEYDMYNKRTDA